MLTQQNTLPCGCHLAQRGSMPGETGKKMMRIYRVELWDKCLRPPQHLQRNANVKSLTLLDTAPMREARHQWEKFSKPENHGCPSLVEPQQPTPIPQPIVAPAMPEQQPAPQPQHIITPQKREPHFNYRTGNWEDGFGNRIENPTRTVEPLASGEEWAERQRIAKEKFDKGKR